MEDYCLQLFKNESSFYNHVVLGSLLPANLWEPLPHFLFFKDLVEKLHCWNIHYFITAFLWSFYIYYLKRSTYLHQDDIHPMKTMALQILVSMGSIPWNTALPTVSEYMVEMGWTECFSTVSEVGWFAYFMYFITYLVFVEFLVYWAHRELHDIKLLYKYLHAQHHKYNKKNKLSPFAGLALNPLDGLLQAVPHVIALFFVPTHLATHLTLLFMEGLWTANIHDCIDGKLWPVMGAGYHTIHHVSSRHNYGHYTVWMDWMFGTLCDPSSNTKNKVA